MFVVAIDGPAGAGKGTIAKAVSDRLGFLNIDTGATYRCLTLAMIRNNIDVSEEGKIKELLNNVDIDMKKIDGVLHVFLDGEDVSSKIRETDVNKMVSQVSSLIFVREKLVELQRKLADGKNVVMEGRDIGTVVFPNADIKIYIDAKPEVRAQRRQKQNEEAGIKSNYEEVLENIRKRDYNDMHKEVGTLKIADGAIVVDVSEGTVEENTNKVLNIIKERMN